MSRDATTLDSVTAQPEAAVDPGVTLSILWHSDLSRVGRQAQLTSEALATAGVSRVSPVFEDGLPLDHRGASRSPVRISRAGRKLRVVGGKAGMAFQVDGAPAKDVVELPAEALARGVRLGLGKRGPLLLLREGRVGEEPPPFGMVGPSQHLARVRGELSRLGPLPFPVLVRGATGTGKELVAQALHQASGRSGRLVAINLAALPPSTAVSQLFGHGRGAFTGADRASGGYFGDAEGGTLFLDEIGAAPAELQAQLLRALESGEVQPVGAPPREVDVRVIAATDADLELAIAEGRFRRPLLHRLAHGRVHLQPLSLRPEDIAAQFVHFARHSARALYGVELPLDWLPREDMERLLSRPWPGNTRELRGVAEQTAASSGRLPRCAPADAAPTPAAQAPPQEDLEATLARHGWALKPTAAALGVGRNTLKRRMRALGIPRPSELEAPKIQVALQQQGSVSAAAAALRVSERGLLLRMGELGLTP